MEKKIILAVVVSLIAVSFSGCRTAPMIETGPEYDKQLPPGELALRKITNPEEIPDFTTACYNLADLHNAIDNSLIYLNKPSSTQFFPYGEVTHQQAMDSLAAFNKLLESGLAGSPLNAAIREQFDVYISVGCDDRGTVLFTGYYTPIFDGSQVRTERFKYPLYKLPADLAKGQNGEILGRRGAGGQLTPYPARAEIESSNMLQGTELIWLGDSFEVYIAHVQGSAKIRLSDGRLVTVGYAANNGHEYHSIADQLVNDGKIDRSQLSLSAMIDYFKAHPDEVTTYTQRNPRFVFFRVEPSEPRGSLNVPVTMMRSIATDKTVFPRASLAFLSTSMPQALGGSQITMRPYSGFALDQDTGGAIRAPGRCDVYMGQGDLAGKLAGQTYQEGKLYYLFLKPTVRPPLSLTPAGTPSGELQDVTPFNPNKAQ